MPSQSSSKTQVEVGLKSQDKEKSPLLQGDMLSRLKLRGKFKNFAQWATGDSNSPVIREIAGTISCMAIVAYVSGYTFGTWFHKTKNQLINKNNDTIDRPL
jgi:hypothetical protein